MRKWRAKVELDITADLPDEMNDEKMATKVLTEIAIKALREDPVRPWREDEP